jgi:hypothetical protein
MLAFAVVLILRSFYIEKIALLFDNTTIGSSLPFTFPAGFVILFTICIVNAWWIRKKINETF